MTGHDKIKLALVAVVLLMCGGLAIVGRLAEWLGQ